MTKLKILIEGYAHPGDNDEYIASPTTSLIVTDNLKILVDPGSNAELLLKKLTENNLTTQDIDLIFLSHYHPDHFLNLSLFPGKDVYDGQIIWRADHEIMHTGDIKGTDIAVIHTPGHTLEQHSLLFNDETLGKVCVCQDVFWWEDGKQDTGTPESLMSLIDPYAADAKLLAESRKKVLEIADWLVPGHGKMFKNPLKA